MGNSSSVIVPEPKKIIFGSVNDDSHPRAGYYQYKNTIKYHTKVITLIPGELPESFKKLKYGYAKTNKRVFYKGVPISGVNPNTFYVINRNNPENNTNSVLGISTGTGTGTITKKIFYKGVFLE